VPTVANSLGVSGAFESCFYGISLVEVLDNPGTCPNEMVVHFTYNDIPSCNAPSIIPCVRTLRYKYAMYFTSDSSDADWELYNLQSGSGWRLWCSRTAQVWQHSVQIGDQAANIMRHMKALPRWIGVATKGHSKESGRCTCDTQWHQTSRVEPDAKLSY
jgi:hypothetical protein